MIGNIFNKSFLKEQLLPELLFLSFEFLALFQDASYENILCYILGFELLARLKSQSCISGLSQPDAPVARASSVVHLLFI